MVISAKRDRDDGAEFAPSQKCWKSDINAEEEVPLLGYVLKVRHKKVQRLQLTLGPSYVLLHLLILRTNRATV